VHRFLDLVSRELEELIRENAGLKEDLKRRDAQIVEFRAHEAQLREALVSAGRMSDEMRASARKEAEVVVAEAEVRAGRIEADARERSALLAAEVHELKRQRARLLGEVRAILGSHARLLDAHEALDGDEA